MDTSADSAMGNTTLAIPAVPLFRSSKKRKMYRQRVEDTQEEAPSARPELETIDDLIASARADAEEKELAEILRLRRHKKLRNGGVEFRADGTSTIAGQNEEELNEDETAAAEQAEAEALKKVVGRFAPQMGIMGSAEDVDRHMMSYIDSELAKRRFDCNQSRQETQSASDTPPTDSTRPEGTENSARPIRERQPAALGKLQEIDLGDEAREYNMSRTRKQLSGEEIPQHDLSKKKANATPKTRPGLGPDGKPWRPRQPRRRNSDDIRRDALVEEVLRENRIEIYDEPQGFAPGKGIYSAEVQEGAADDRVAEEFTREFMDAISQRQRRRAAPDAAKKSAKLTREEELMKGPKLGGSKAQRAAMRELVLKGEIPPPRVRK